MTASIPERVHSVLAEDAEACRDVPEEACAEQPRNFLVHAASLSATKTADGLADPKLVLSWLLTQLGAPAVALGLLVPIREAGALAPQLAIAPWIRTRAQRKWVWAGASVAQGLAAAGMALAATTLEGGAAVWTIVGLLCVLALARSFASVSYKDVLGRTVSKSARGTATGTAATTSGAVVLAYGAALATGLVPLDVATVAGGLLCASLLWLGAGATFATLAEERASAPADDSRSLRSQLALLRDRPQLRRFIATRALLVATALGPPFLVLLGGTSESGLGSLGPLVVASSVASLASSYLWGRLADRSSRRTLLAAGAIAAATYGAAAFAAFTTESLPIALVGALMFCASVAHQGVRLGRSTHLVDMAPDADRPAYTALSNTIIGAVLVCGAGLGVLAQLAGLVAALLLLAVLSLASTFVAQGLEEVQRRS